MFGQVINGVGVIVDFGLKWGKGFKKQAAHSSKVRESMRFCDSQLIRTSAMDILNILWIWTC